MEKLELINLARGATEFHVQEVEVWYLHWYNKVTGWFSKQWNKILFYLAIVIGSAFVLFCMFLLLYLTCCANIWGKNIRERQRPSWTTIEILKRRTSNANSLLSKSLI